MTREEARQVMRDILEPYFPDRPDLADQAADDLVVGMERARLTEIASFAPIQPNGAVN